jgi:hypothetical protein
MCRHMTGGGGGGDILIWVEHFFDILNIEERTERNMKPYVHQAQRKQIQ